MTVSKTIILENQKEFIEFQLKLIFYNFKPITVSDIKILTYIYLYEERFAEELMKDNIFKSYKSIENSCSKLRGIKNLIVGKKTNLRLNEKLSGSLSKELFTYEINFKWNQS